MAEFRAKGYCFHCAEPGHIAAYCLYLSVNNMEVSEEGEEEIVGDERINESLVYTDSPNPPTPNPTKTPENPIKSPKEEPNAKKLLITQMKLLGKRVRVLIDGGSQSNFVDT